MSKYADRIQGALKALGGLESPGRIADHLVCLGIKGYASNPWSCPVANYVKLVAAIPPGVIFSISPTYWSVQGPSELAEMGSVIPAPVSDFISLFDRQQFPSLSYAVN